MACLLVAIPGGTCYNGQNGGRLPEEVRLPQEPALSCGTLLKEGVIESPKNGRSFGSHSSSFLVGLGEEFSTHLSPLHSFLQIRRRENASWKMPIETTLPEWQRYIADEKFSPLRSKKLRNLVEVIRRSFLHPQNDRVLGENMLLTYRGVVTAPTTQIFQVVPSYTYDTIFICTKADIQHPVRLVWGKEHHESGVKTVPAAFLDSVIDDHIVPQAEVGGFNFHRIAVPLGNIPFFVHFDATGIASANVSITCLTVGRRSVFGGGGGNIDVGCPLGCGSGATDGAALSAVYDDYHRPNSAGVVGWSSTTSGHPYLGNGFGNHQIFGNRGIWTGAGAVVNWVNGGADIGLGTGTFDVNPGVAGVGVFARVGDTINHLEAGFNWPSNVWHVTRTIAGVPVVLGSVSGAIEPAPKDDDIIGARIGAGGNLTLTRNGNIILIQPLGGALAGNTGWGIGLGSTTHNVKYFTFVPF